MRNQSYDYIIVGAGSAGCTMAYRLGADPNLKILVLEAGGSDRSPMIKIPLTWGLILKNRYFDWGYFTHQESQMNHRQIECARGKIIGGSSSINGMAYARGAPEDYDGWCQDFGLTDWSYEKVLPFFKKSESWQDGANAWRGYGGPLHVSQMIYKDPLLDSFFQTVQEMGYSLNDDYNAQNIDGFAHMQTTIRNGKRWSAASAYLYPALKKGNVDVMTHVLVHKVKLQAGKAVGVELSIDGKLQTIFANNEVILCAGVINSPQLLMLSGIGDPIELENHGIEINAAIPGVGKNLHDHIVCDVRWRRNDNGPLFEVLRYDRIFFDLIKTALLGTGLSGQVPAAAVGHIKSDKSLALADLQLILAAAPMNAGPHLHPLSRSYDDAYALKGVYLTPKSRGEIKLIDGNPRSKPKIIQNFIHHDVDRVTLRRMVKIMRSIGDKGRFAKHAKAEISPGPLVTTDDEIDVFIANNAITLHHPVGTCRMGSMGDPMSVINEKMQVNGVEGLRVVDGSSMPRVVRGPVNAPIIMMAEKIAESILMAQ
jgi:4-pyridoxate dehydrogenase